jgi:uncharacterized protein
VIRTAREMAGLSQAELARRIGTSQPALSAYERGHRPVSPELVRRILETLGIMPHDRLAIRRARVRELVRQRRGHDLRVVGSVARGDDDIDSDIDLLISFERGVGLFEVEELRLELEDLLGCGVHVIPDGRRLEEDQRFRGLLEEAVPV